MRTHRHKLRARLTLVAAAMLIAVLAVVAQAASAGPVVATEQLGGTSLTVLPQIPYQSATLRIAGPQGYSFAKTFDGAAPITADLPDVNYFCAACCLRFDSYPVAHGESHPRLQTVALGEAKTEGAGRGVTSI